jgi:hypothetical protein
MNKMAHTYFSGLALGSWNPPLLLDMSTIINKTRNHKTVWLSVSYRGGQELFVLFLVYKWYQSLYTKFQH